MNIIYTAENEFPDWQKYKQVKQKWKSVHIFWKKNKQKKNSNKVTEILDKCLWFS